MDLAQVRLGRVDRDTRAMLDSIAAMGIALDAESRQQTQRILSVLRELVNRAPGQTCYASGDQVDPPSIIRECRIESTSSVQGWRSANEGP
jgi:hypothetical protein